MPTAMHNLLFGDSLDQTVGYIVGQSVRSNTTADYLKAAHKLEGIRSFLIFMEGDGGRSRMTYALIAMGNEINRMYQMADDEKMRVVVAEEMQQATSPIDKREELG
jgi:hypothetical protein